MGLVAVVMIMAWFWDGFSAQYIHLPRIPCPDIFKYVWDGHNYMGLLTIRDVGYGKTTVHVKLSEQGTRLRMFPDYVGDIYPNIEKSRVPDYIRTGTPIPYIVKFPLQNVVPRVIEISVNDVRICSGPKYNRPRETIKLQHTIRNIRRLSAESQSNENLLADPNFSFDLSEICGKENSKHVKKLAVYGEIIATSQFPWIVAIYTRKMSALEFQCGGSLISSRTVVSAAHCFQHGSESIPADNLLLSMGRHNLNEWQNAVNIGVQRLITHPDFRAHGFDADVAVVQLNQSVSFSMSVRPICLWKGSTDVRAIEGSKGIIVGWGEDELHTGPTTVPKLVTTTIVSDVTCLRSNERFFYMTSNRTLCAGNRDGSGPCLGDSGSGLMIRNGDTWVLRGIVSASLLSDTQKCNMNEYVVYSDVAKFTEWINSNMLR